MSKRMVNVKRQRVDLRVRSLLDGNRKQAVTFKRVFQQLLGEVESRICLTTSSASASLLPLATADSAMLVGDGNSSAFIKYIDLREVYDITAGAGAGVYANVRRVVVCWKRLPVLTGSVGNPPSVPLRNDLSSGGGQILCEALQFDCANANSFTVLDDSVVRIDRESTGDQIFKHVRIPINRRMTFMSPATSSQNGGHLDPSVSAGFVRSNLITVHYISTTSVRQTCTCMVDYYM